MAELYIYIYMVSSVHHVNSTSSADMRLILRARAEFTNPAPHGDFLGVYNTRNDFGRVKLVG